MRLLNRKFFERPTLKVAQELLGKFLCCKLGGQTAKYMITEVEAYDGQFDKASHAHRGKTPRNAPMFGEAGVWYVYFIYGMYFMLNVVTGKKDYPAAVLIRGVKSLRCRTPKLNGPGKLTKFLKIDKKFNAKSATPKTGLWIEDHGVKIKKLQIKSSPRIGVHYAEEWKDKKFRFHIS